MNKGYVYIGEHYDISGRPLSITDKKIGLTVNPEQRESSLSRTKSPILYRHIKIYEVDDMYKVEKLLHAILSSRNTNGEWFEDNDDSLVNDFSTFIEVYGGTQYESVGVESNKEDVDDRLKKIADELGETQLVRRYVGQDHEVTLTKEGRLRFMGEEYPTPNLCFNKGIVKYVKGHVGGSGTNGLNQFIIKDTGEKLGSYQTTNSTLELFINGKRYNSTFDYEYIIKVVKLAVNKIGLHTLINSSDIVKLNYTDFPQNVLDNYGPSIKKVDDYHVLTWGNKNHKKKKIKEVIEVSELYNVDVK